MLDIRIINNSNEKSNECSNIIKALPQWFGIPKANEHYINNIANIDVYGAYIQNNIVGMVGIKKPFPETIDIWWMGVKPQFHRQGVGKALINKITNTAQTDGFNYVVVETLSDECSDIGYKNTRLFYTAMGFNPLLKHDYNGKENPMIYMIKTINPANGTSQAK